MLTTTQISLPLPGDPDEFADVDVTVEFRAERDRESGGIHIEIERIETCDTSEELDARTYCDEVRDACVQAWADAQRDDPDEWRERQRDARRDAA